MSWVKLDDRFFDNPKIAALSDAAKVAYLEATCYCARELTDGFVPLRKARDFAGKPRVIKELAPQLWEPCDSGFRVHDYLKYNPTRAAVLAEREAARRRMFGRNSGEVQPKSERNSDAPVNPVNPLPSSRSPGSHDPPPQPRSFPQRAVVVSFEQCFGRLLSPTEIELIKALEEEQPPERIEYALREAAALNKRSVRYVQRTCERMASDGDDSSRASSGKSTKGSDSEGVANRVRRLVEQQSGVPSG